MPETANKLEEVTKEDKKDALDAVIIDIMADGLPVDIQEKLPNGGNTVVQAPGDKLTVKTGIVEEVSKVKLVPPKPVKSIAGTIATVSIISTVMQKIDKNKAANANTILHYIGDGFVRDGKLMQDDKFTVPNMDMTQLRKGMKIAGKAFVAAGHVCLTASKAAAFFSTFSKK